MNPAGGAPWELLDAAPDAMLVVNARRGIVFANAQTERMFGYSRAELQEAALELLLPARYHERHAQHLANYFAAPHTRPMGPGLDLVGRRKDGREFLLEISLSPVSIGGEAMVIAAIRDVTARRESEETLRRTAEDLAITLRSIGDGVIVTDVEDRVTRLNPAAEQLTKWTSEDATGRRSEEVFQIFNETTRLPVESPIRQVLRQGRAAELANHTILRARDSTERPIADCAAPVRDANGAVRGVVLVFRDKTVEHAAERALRDSEELARSLFDGAPDALVIVDVRGSIQKVNRQTENIFGYESGELPGQSIEVLIPERFRDRHAGHVSGFAAQPRTRTMGKCLDLQGKRKDGSEFPVDISLSPVTTGAGVLIAAAIRDVTERARADQARDAAQRDAEGVRAQLEGVLANIPDYVVSVDAGGVIQFVNRVQAHRTREQVVGTPLLQYLAAEQHAEMQSALQRVFTTGETAILQVTTTGPDDQPRWFEIHLGPVRRADSIVGAVIIARDITEKRRVETLLVTSERMASMGTLAAGVAHEINNPLAAVVGNLELATEELTALSKRVDIPEDLFDGLRDARDAADRVRAIVRDLKLFARNEDVRTGPVDVQRVMESTLRMVWNEIRHRARLIKLYGNVPWVEANEARLGQVFINLIVNAAQSIKEGHVDSNEIRISTRLDTSGEVVVEISDTGCGMTPEVRARLFTPFFTTKRAGEGTGLGLSICQSIVTDLKGRMEVDSQLGMGTTFRVHLPPALPEPALDAALTAVTSRARRRGLILAIDDEPMIARIISRALSREHEVVACLHAREALDRLVVGARFDVILCDLMMPDLTGMEFLDELQRIDPAQVERVIFVTGGAFTEDAREFLERVTNLRIEKPFDAQQLRALVNDRIR